MPARGEVPIRISAKVARAVADWLSRSRGPHVRTIFTDIEAERTAISAHMQRLEKQARSARGPREVRFSRSDLRLILAWLTVPRRPLGASAWSHGVTMRAPLAVHVFARRCREALTKRRGNPRFRLLTTAQVRDRVAAGTLEDSHLRRLRWRLPEKTPE